MNENEQQNVSRETSKAQRSGFDGERRDSEAVELSPQGEASERSSSRRVSRETSEGPKKNKRSSFFVYLAVLFGAAFLMLLLAYFVQQRNNQTTIDGLQDSMNLSRTELMEEIAKLKEEKTGLETQIAQLEQQLKQEQEYSQQFQTLYDGARSSASHSEYFLCKRSEAMELFWQLDRAYTQSRNQRCRELIELLEAPEAEPLKNYLPGAEDRESYDNGGWLEDAPSPAERYQEIFERLS